MDKLLAAIFGDKAAPIPTGKGDPEPCVGCPLGSHAGPSEAPSEYDSEYNCDSDYGPGCKEWFDWYKANGG